MSGTLATRVLSPGTESEVGQSRQVHLITIATAAPQVADIRHPTAALAAGKGSYLELPVPLPISTMRGNGNWEVERQAAP